MSQLEQRCGLRAGHVWMARIQLLHTLVLRLKLFVLSTPDICQFREFREPHSRRVLAPTDLLISFCELASLQKRVGRAYQ